MAGSVVRRLEVVEPVSVLDTFVDGISSIQYKDDVVRVEFYVQQEGGENAVAVRLMFGASAWSNIMDDLRAGKCAQGADLAMH